MNIELEVKEITNKLGFQNIDVKLLKNISKFLGGEHSRMRDKISLSNKDQLKDIKQNFLIGVLNIEKAKASQIVKKVLSRLDDAKTIFRSTFYYLIITELNSPDRRIRNIHPGEILLEEFLKPLGISAYKLSKDIGVPQTRTSMILKGERGITADTALRLSKYFGTSSKFWLGLQNDYDLEESKKSNILDLVKIKKCA